MSGEIPKGRVIWRTVAVLEEIAASEKPLGPRELSRRTNIDRSGVSRILKRLVEMGVLEKVPDGYVPGYRLLSLGRTVVSKDSFTSAALPILRRLSTTYDETCYVCVRRGDQAVHIGGIESSNPIRYVVPLGEPFPLYAGAPGRGILSGLSEVEVSDILDRVELEAITSETATDRTELEALVRADRARGYAVSAGQRIEGGFGIAAPFFDSSGICQGSVVFTSPIARLDESRVGEYGDAVAAAALELSLRLGYQVAQAKQTFSPG